MADQEPHPDHALSWQLSAPEAEIHALPLMVGLGGGDGSLPALRRLFSTIPAQVYAAFILVSHLPADQLLELLEHIASSSSWPCQIITDGLPVQAGHIYWAPGGLRIILEARRFRLTAPPSDPLITLTPADMLLRSLAHAAGARALAALLSGSGSAGVQGIAHIKACGGITVVQEPDTALNPQLPRNALATELIDHSLAPESIAALIVRTAQALEEQAGRQRTAAAEQATIDTLLSLLQRETGYDFRHYKRTTIKRRIERRLSLHQSASLNAYVETVRQHPGELRQLFQDLLISVTTFFRDPEAFDGLKEQALVPLVREHPVERPLRIWVPACATGEEAYSLAMMLLEQLEANHISCALHIFATDINEAALDVARLGEYSESSVSTVSPARLERFFTPSSQGYRVNKQLRTCVTFARHNLTVDPPFSKIDLISCRNLLIYLEPVVQNHMLALFHFALNRNGLLFLGNAETVGVQEQLFSTLSKPWRIYQRTSAASRIQFNVRPRREQSNSQRSPDFALVSPPRSALTTAISQLLLNRFVPTTVLINPHFECLYVHNPLGANQSILQIPSGAPTQDLLALLDEELRAPLRVAVAHASREQRRVGVQATLRRPAGLQLLEIVVQPLSKPGNLLVSFLEPNFGATDAHLVAPPALSSASADPAIRQLEYELAMTREDLQNTIGELATSNADLTAINEEMASINEELQSTNEELETSKEELQSLNEELIAINTQLQEKIAELELTSNDLLNLLSSTDMATLFLDLKLHIKRYTPAVTMLFNLIPNDVGRALSDITRRFEEPDLIREAQRVIVTLQPSHREIQKDDGRWFMRRILPYRTLDNRIEGVVITFAEVSELKQIEQALRLSEQRFRTALRNSPITVFEQDRNLRYTWIYNPAFGHDVSQIVGQTDADLFDDPDALDRLTAMKHQVMQSGRGQRQELSVHQDGQRYVFDISVEPLPQDTLVTGITCVVNDITAHAQLQEERLLLLERAEAARVEAEHAVQLRNVFVSIASHELKTPLTALLGNASLLSQRMQRSEPLDERSQRFAQTVVTQAERLNTLLTLLLDVSRIDSGALMLSLDSVDIGALVAQTIAEIQPTLVSHTLQYRPPAQPLWVEGDSVRLQQVLHNVLGNAVKYSPEGGTIEVSVFATQASVAIAISDPGIGIPETAQVRIFEQFYRAANAEAAHIQGMGIGLFVVQQIIRLHGGTLHVRSQVGMGSTFTILLPTLVERGLHV